MKAERDFAVRLNYAGIIRATMTEFIKNFVEFGEFKGVSKRTK
jgi:hypothetical protein